MESWHQMSMHHQTVLIQSSNLCQLVCQLSVFSGKYLLQKQMLKVFTQKCSPKHQQRSSLPFIMFLPAVIPHLFKGNKEKISGGGHLRRAENTNIDKTQSLLPPRKITWLFHPFCPLHITAVTYKGNTWTTPDLQPTLQYLSIMGYASD